MCRVRISGECKADKLHARYASTVALNKLFEYLLAANSILPSLFAYPPTLTLPVPVKPESNLHITSDNNTSNINNVGEHHVQS